VSSLWEEHKWRIIGIISVSVLEALLIAGLLIQRSRRRRVEEALSANQKRLALAQEAGQVGTFDWDIQNDVILWSEEMKPLYGLQQDDDNVRAEAWLKRVHPEDYAAAAAAVEGAKRTGEIDVEWRVIWPDGSIHWLHVRGKSISNRHGEPIRMVGVNVDITERKRVEEALQESEEALRESYERVEDLAGRLIVAQEYERKHIAREIHDDLNQQVAALAIGLSKLNRQLTNIDGSIGNQIAKLQDRTIQLSDRMRQISHELHSSTLEHVGLPEALKSFCAEFTEQHGIAVTLDIKDNLRALPADLSLCLYRVVQESLRNIAKHSGAKSAQVTLACTGDDIELSVADQGVGFDPEQADLRRGLGLISLEERVKLMHGRFEVKSQPGAGSELRASIPLRKDDYFDKSDYFSTLSPHK
jgi:PAS domain S-box-containing protein